MNNIPLRTTVIGSYPLPGWYEYAFSNITSFGYPDRNELIEDAVTVAIKDQVSAELDVITDGEMSTVISLHPASSNRFNSCLTIGINASVMI